MDFEELQNFGIILNVYLMHVLLSCARRYPKNDPAEKNQIYLQSIRTITYHIKHRFKLQGVPQGICGPVIEENGKKRIMIYSDFEQNVLLNRTEPSYMQTVSQSCEGDSARAQAWTRGDWSVVSGGFFDEIFYKYGNTIKEPSFDPPEGGHYFFSYDHGGPRPACFLYAWENTDGRMCFSMTAKSAAARRGDIHLIGEKYFWTGKPNEGSNMSIANMLRAHTEYKIQRGWRRRDPVSGKWSDIMKRGCADLQIWDDTNEQGSDCRRF